MSNYYIDKINQLKKEYLNGKNLDIKMRSKFLPDDIDYVKLDGSIHYKKDNKIKFIINNNISNKKKVFKIFLTALFDVPYEFLEINFDCSFIGICNIETIELINKDSKEWLTKYVKILKKYPDFTVFYSNKNGVIEKIHTKNSEENEQYNLTVEEFLEKILFNVNVDSQLKRYNIEYLNSNKGLAFNDFKIFRKNQPNQIKY